jgi:chromosome segregation ATPase
MADNPDRLRAEIDNLRRHIEAIESQVGEARRDAREAREEAMRLHDAIAAAQRDQQDLRTARARLKRVTARGLFARVLNRS